MSVAIKKVFKSLFLGSLILGLAILGLLFFFGWEQSSLVLTPVKNQVSEKDRQISETPEAYGLSITPFTVTSVEGFPFRACLIKATGTPPVGPSLRQNRMRKLLIERNNLPTILSPGARRGTIILSHSYGKSMEEMYGVAEFLTAANFDCIAYDIRAHGTRENEICSYGEKEKGELQLVINAATQQFGDLGNIGAFGEGLGAAITLQALPSLPEVRSVALLNSFSTLKDTVWEIITQRHGKALGFVFYLVGDQILSWRADFRFSSITPVASAAKTNIPALVACSEKDSEFDSEAAQKIYEAFASKEKVLYTPFLRPGSSDYPKDNDELFALIIEWFVHHNHPQAPEVLPHIRRVPLPHPK